jgi:hypothetical protein
LKKSAAVLHANRARAHSAAAAADRDSSEDAPSGAFKSKLLQALPASTYSRESAGGGHLIGGEINKTRKKQQKLVGSKRVGGREDDYVKSS